MHPLLADDAGEANPDGRTTQVRCIADQRIAIEVFSKDFFTEGNPFFLTHLVDTMGLPGFIGGLHDEGGCTRFELISVRLEPAMLGLDERESERVKCFLGAQPYETALAGIDVGLEGIGVTGTHAAVQTVGGNNEVSLVLDGDFLVIGYFFFEDQIDVELFTTVLQDVQQLLAANADKAVA